MPRGSRAHVRGVVFNTAGRCENAHGVPGSLAIEHQPGGGRRGPGSRGRIAAPGVLRVTPMSAKLAIVGYGKMGRLIEQLAPEYGFTVHCCVDVNDDFRQAAGADVAIEFTHPAAVVGNVETLSAMNVPVVTGTTGWL